MVKLVDVPISYRATTEGVAPGVVQLRFEWAGDYVSFEIPQDQFRRFAADMALTALQMEAKA
jgi:hypothetical protein